MNTSSMIDQVTPGSKAGQEKSLTGASSGGQMLGDEVENIAF